MALYLRQIKKRAVSKGRCDVVVTLMAWTQFRQNSSRCLPNKQKVWAVNLSKEEKTMTRLQSAIALATASALALGVATGVSAQTTDTQTTTQSQTTSPKPEKDVVGMPVLNTSGEQIGSIEEIVLKKADNEKYAVVSVGGFLGMGSKDVAVPYEDLSVGSSNVILVTQGNEEDIERLPEYDPKAFQPAEADTMKDKDKTHKSDKDPYR